MKVLLSASNFGLGGVVGVARNLARHLAGRCELTVIGDAEGHELGTFRALGARCFVFRGHPIAKALRLRALAHALRPDVFLPGFSAYEYIYLHRFPRRTRILQVIHSDHVSWEEKLAHVERVADGAVFVSAFLFARHGAGLHCPAFHIPNFVPAGLPPRPVTDGGPLRVLYSGRLVDEAKRVLAIPEILRGIAGVELLLAGEGADAETLFARLRAADVRFTWAGLLREDAMADLYRRADVILLPSSYEGLPLALLEAMATGCVPVVSALRSGMTEAVDAECGYTVEPENLGAFRDVIAGLAADRTPLRPKGEAARARVMRSYSSAVCGPLYEQAMQRLLLEPGTRRRTTWLPRPLPGKPLFGVMR